MNFDFNNEGRSHVMQGTLLEYLKTYSKDKLCNDPIEGILSRSNEIKANMKFKSLVNNLKRSFLEPKAFQIRS